MNSNGAFVKTILIFAGTPAGLWSSVLWVLRENVLTISLNWIEWILGGLHIINVVIMVVALRYYSVIAKQAIKYGRAFLVQFSLSAFFFWGFILIASVAVGDFPNFRELVRELIPAVWLPLVLVGLIVAAFRKRIVIKDFVERKSAEGDILDQHMVKDE